MTSIFDVPGSNRPNPFSTPIQALLTTTSPSSSTATEDDTVTSLVTCVTTSTDPSRALWQLWDAFFIAVATCRTSHTPHLSLLDALQRQQPTRPDNVQAGSDAERQLSRHVHADSRLHWSTLPGFSAQWRDVHDILEAWRDWDGVRASGHGSTGTSPANCYLSFCAFAASLLKVKTSQGKGKVDVPTVHPIWVFYACRQVLECEHQDIDSAKPKPHKIPADKVWALDVRVAAMWVRDGARALWETDRDELQRHWAAALDERTELWPRDDGLVLDRWRLWAERLRDLSTDEEHLDDETRGVLIEAAAVVGDILGQQDD